MTTTSALQLAGTDAASREDREQELVARELELAALKVELQKLQSRYLTEVGASYAQLTELEAAIADIEIRAGMRPPPDEIDDIDEIDEQDEAGDRDAGAGGGCDNRGLPSDALKRVFRDVAKAIHPDLALDEPARCRRHSLMAEANRAYAERDEDRLRLILRAWERSPEAVIGDDPGSHRERQARRVAESDARLVEIERELADLRASAIWRLKGKIDEARAQGWDLFAEMVLQVKREVARASARLASLRRARPDLAPGF
jgi:hypothetical protein